MTDFQHPERKILLNPGPATTTDSVKWSQVVPDICPREQEFQQVMADIRTELVKIAGGDAARYAAVLFSGSGTAAMEAAVSSTLPTDGKLMILINGAYGQRLAKIARAYQIDYIEYQVDWGRPIDWPAVKSILSDNDKISHLAMVHHETTTGILNPLEPFCQVAREFKLVTMVDTISSYAGYPLDLTQTPVDLLMSTSNKCLQGMAGVAFIIASLELLQEIRRYPPRNLYLDLARQFAYQEQTGQTRFTPPVQTIYALRQAIAELNEEGLEQRWQRYASNYRILIEGLERMGFRLLLDDQVEHSRILATIFEPDDPNYNFNRLHDYLYNRGYTIYPGKVSELNTFRLSILGALQAGDINDFLQALAAAVRDLEIKIVYDNAD